MSEIKFRALDANGNFVYGALIRRNSDGNEQLYIYDTRIDETEINQYAFGGDGKYDLRDCFIPVQKGTEGQFTCLLDKNGVEIYEGDIVKEDRYNDGTDMHIFDIHDHSFCANTGLEPDIENCEVIGNIYKNPELLK